MSEQNANPVELFGMRVAHVGINATDPADALEIAELFSTMMGLPVIETPVSYFNDSLVEIMKQNGRGTKGHIGFAVNDIDAAEKWFAERGVEVNEEARRQPRRRHRGDLGRRGRQPLYDSPATIGSPSA